MYRGRQQSIPLSDNVVENTADMGLGDLINKQNMEHAKDLNQVETKKRNNGQDF